MTTIVTTKNFLIADHRSTIILDSKESYTDNKSKISVNIKATVNKLNIKAAAIAGHGLVGNYLIKLLKDDAYAGHDVKEVLYALQDFPVVPQYDRSCTVVLLLENGQICTIEHKVNRKVQIPTLNFGVHLKKPNAGSGWGIFGSGAIVLQELMYRIPGGMNELDPTDAFYFATQVDSCSSSSYSVYSLQDDRLYACVLPTEAEIHERVGRVLAKIDFMGVKYKKQPGAEYYFAE